MSTTIIVIEMADGATMMAHVNVKVARGANMIVIGDKHFAYNGLRTLGGKAGRHRASFKESEPPIKLDCELVPVE